MTSNEAHADGGCASQQASDADESDLAALRDRVDELDAAVQAIRGLLGEVRAVDRDVERRADLALARTDRLRDRLDAVASAVDHDLPDADAVDGEPNGAESAAVGGEHGAVDVDTERDARNDRHEDVLEQRDSGEEWGLAERLRETL